MYCKRNFKLPVKYSKAVTVVEGMTTISLNELKNIQVLYNKRKLNEQRRSSYSHRSTKAFAKTATNKGKEVIC